MSGTSKLFVFLFFTCVSPVVLWSAAAKDSSEGLRIRTPAETSEPSDKTPEPAPAEDKVEVPRSDVLTIYASWHKTNKGWFPSRDLTTGEPQTWGTLSLDRQAQQAYQLSHLRVYSSDGCLYPDFAEKVMENAIAETAGEARPHTLSETEFMKGYEFYTLLDKIQKALVEIPAVTLNDARVFGYKARSVDVLVSIATYRECPDLWQERKSGDRLVAYEFDGCTFRFSVYELSGTLLSTFSVEVPTS